jgi:hypothetical protein
MCVESIERHEDSLVKVVKALVATIAIRRRIRFAAFRLTFKRYSFSDLVRRAIRVVVPVRLTSANEPRAFMTRRASAPFACQRALLAVLGLYVTGVRR